MLEFMWTGNGEYPIQPLINETLQLSLRGGCSDTLASIGIRVTLKPSTNCRDKGTDCEPKDGQTRMKLRNPVQTVRNKVGFRIT